MLGRFRSIVEASTRLLRGKLGSRRLPERRVFELTDEDVFRITQAGKKNAHPGIVLRRQNAVWFNIARERRFDVRTVQPIEGRDFHFFTAIPLPDDDRDGGVIILPTDI
jgi:hypothetical protein